MSKLRSELRQSANRFVGEVKIDKPILVIEDQPTLLKMLTDMIKQRYGCEVHTSSSFAEAKVQLSKYRNEYHMVICDLNLPDAPNGEIVDLVNRAKVKMIVLTGSFCDDMRETMIEKGVIDYVSKDSLNAFNYVVDLVGRIYRNRSTKILVVEDSLSVRALLEHMLVVQGFIVFTAENGKKALDIINENSEISLMLTDYNMPEMDGFTLTIEVRKKFSKEQLSIIGLSALGKSELGSLFIKNGANDFMLKPFSYEELLCRINQNVDLLEHMESLRNLANRDFLTKLYNRRFFFSEGETLYTQAEAQKSSLVVCLLDIDHFKNVNDTYGHDCGDKILIHFSTLLRDFFTNDLVARIGGEEFVVLLKNIDINEVSQLMNDFRELVANTTTLYDDQSISVSISAGLNDCLNGNIDTILKVADEKLYWAKERGRNQVVF